MTRLLKLHVPDMAHFKLSVVQIDSVSSQFAAIVGSDCG